MFAVACFTMQSLPFVMVILKPHWWCRLWHAL